MGYHLPDYKLTNEWVDLASIAEYSAIVDSLVTVQAKYVLSAYIWIGGASAPDKDSGSLLTTGVAISTTSNHWWVKGDGTLSVLMED